MNKAYLIVGTHYDYDIYGGGSITFPHKICFDKNLAEVYVKQNTNHFKSEYNGCLYSVKELDVLGKEIKITKDYLISKYHIAVAERDALNNGILNEEEMAGYWLYEASPNTRQEFDHMLKMNDVLLSQDEFYKKVNDYLIEVGY